MRYIFKYLIKYLIKKIVIYQIDKFVIIFVPLFRSFPDKIVNKFKVAELSSLYQGGHKVKMTPFFGKHPNVFSPNLPRGITHRANKNIFLVGHPSELLYQLISPNLKIRLLGCSIRIPSWRFGKMLGMTKTASNQRKSKIRPDTLA